MSVRGGRVGTTKKKMRKKEEEKGHEKGIRWYPSQSRPKQTSSYNSFFHTSYQTLYNNYNVIIVCKREMYSFKRTCTCDRRPLPSKLYPAWSMKTMQEQTRLKSGHFHRPSFISPLHLFEPSGLSGRPSAIATTRQLRRFCHFQPSADKDVTAGWGRPCRFLGDSWLTPWERRCRADDCFHTQQYK